MNEKLEKIIDFIVLMDKMKTIERRTKLIFQDTRENDAEHSFHITLMASILQEYAPDADLQKTMEMCLVHDIVEIDAGDTFAYDEEGYKTKKDREQKAAQRIFGILPKKMGSYYKGLWGEFEEGKSPEAQFANAMDRMQPILNNIYNHGGTWNEYEVSWNQLMGRMEPIRRFSEELFIFLAERAKEYFEDAPHTL
ncbi:MAG: HD domain-containing protein [Tissierellia bacterium]|nr:HD domain-containing protein [Tissierellia bacterium]